MSTLIPNPCFDSLMEFVPFQCWLQLLDLVVFHLKGDFPSNVVLILIILNLLLWLLYYTVNLWNACFWTNLSCSFTSYKRKFNLVKSPYDFVIWKRLKCIENWRGSPLLHLLPSGDQALWKVANGGCGWTVISTESH